VLVDTEAEGHRVAFNEAFIRKGLDHQWGLEQYGELLETGGGKERMDVYFSVRPVSLFLPIYITIFFSSGSFFSLLYARWVIKQASHPG
jgi:hypothetical protein